MQGMEAGDVRFVERPDPHVEVAVRTLAARRHHRPGEWVEVVTSARGLAGLGPITRVGRYVLAVNPESAGPAVTKFVVVNGQPERWPSSTRLSAGAGSADLERAFAHAAVVLLEPAPGDVDLLDHLAPRLGIGIVHEVPFACLPGILAAPLERMRHRYVLAADAPGQAVVLRPGLLDRLPAAVRERWGRDLRSILAAALGRSSPLLHLPGYEIGVEEIDVDRERGVWAVWVNGELTSLTTFPGLAEQDVVEFKTGGVGRPGVPFTRLLHAPLYAARFGTPRPLGLSAAPPVDPDPLWVDGYAPAVDARRKHVKELSDFLCRVVFADTVPALVGRLVGCDMRTMLWAAVADGRPLAVVWYDRLNAFAGAIAAPDVAVEGLAWQLFDALATRIGRSGDGGASSLQALVLDRGPIPAGMEPYRVNEDRTPAGSLVEMRIQLNSR